MPGFVVHRQFGFVVHGLRALRIGELDGQKTKKFSKCVSFPIELPTDYVCCVVLCKREGKENP